MQQRYYSLDENGRIAASSNGDFPQDAQSVFFFPDSFDFSHQRDYKLQNGELVYDPLPPVAALPTKEEINAANIDYIAMMCDIDLEV